MVEGAENDESAEEAALAIEPPRATKSHLATFSAANSLKRPIHSLQFEHLLYRSLAPWTENSLHLSEDLAEGWRGREHV